MFGKAISPVFEPLGFDWKMDVGLLTGMGAKEIVASTIGVLYSGDGSVSEIMSAEGVTPLVAFSFLVFVLLYFPCIATLAAIKQECGSWRWALFAAFYTTGLAWLCSAIIYQIGRLII